MGTKYTFLNDTQYNRLFKNRIINGDFSVWQRGIIHSLKAGGIYAADRWRIENSAKQSSIVRGMANFGEKANTLDIFGDGSCIATYTFDGNANNLSGNYNGTWSGTEQYDTGVFGQAAKFDGSSYINCGNDPVDEDSSYTVSVWGKYSGGDYLISSGGQTTSTGYSIYYISSNAVIFSVRTSTYEFPDYRWNGDTTIFRHFVIVHDSNAKILKIFVDGELQAILHPNSASYSNAFPELHLGKPNNENQYYFQGLIDQVRIFNRALTDDEIPTLFYESQPQSLYGATHKVLETPDYSTDYVKAFVYRFEGQHLYDLASAKKKVTLSFDFMATKAGDYCVALINKTDSSNIESLIVPFTYSTPNTKERIVVTFDLSEFTTPVKSDENLGFELVICGMTDNATYVGTGGLNTGEKFSISGGVRLEAGDYISIDKVQLEEGEVATEFEHVPYDIQLMRCMRYYEEGCGLLKLADGPQYTAGNYLGEWISFKVPKRIVPSVTESILHFAQRSDGTWEDAGVKYICYDGYATYVVTHSNTTSWLIKRVVYKADAEL